jgi:hypothetical protein
MTITIVPRRRSVCPQPGEEWETLATRIFPEQDLAKTIEQLHSWNLHISFRVPTGKLLPSDVVFLEPPSPECS